MTRAAPVRAGVTFDEYLKLEETNTVKHEYVHGQMFMLAGASDLHNRLSFRLASLLEADGEAHDCTVYLLDLKIRVPDGPAYYPDVFVTCEDEDDSYVKRKPRLIAEVLSPSTEAVDRGEKLLNYQKLGTLQAYVLLSQDLPRAEVYRRDGEGWRYELKEAGETLTLPCVGLEVSLDSLYKRL